MPTKTINGVPPWISGPKPAKPLKEWATFVAQVLLGTHGKLDPEDKTSTTENALGIKKSCRYWFICRADATRGQFLFCWRASIEEWPGDEHGVLPFDSGGLYHGWIKTDPTLDVAERATLFAKYDKPLRGWLAEFDNYIDQHYPSLADYVRASLPKPGLAEIIYDMTKNAPLAWTWEARAGREMFSVHVRLASVYFTEEDADDFVKWLHEPSNPYERAERLRILDLFTSLAQLRQISPALATILNQELVKQSEEGFPA